MTTMNNTKKNTYIHMNITALNGKCFEINLDLSPLAQEEINPVLDCLVHGGLDPRFDTPQVCEYIQSIVNCAAEILLYSCFNGREYDHFYTVSLISDIMQVGLCSEECAVKMISEIHRLYVNYLEGSEDAIKQIARSLYEFFADTAPFVFDVI